MLAREKKRPISIRVTIEEEGKAQETYNLQKARDLALIRRLRKLNRAKSDSVPASEIFKDLFPSTPKPAVVLRGARVSRGLTQVQLAKAIKGKQGDISAMENGRRTIGREMAKRLGKVLNIDYRVFL